MNPLISCPKCGSPAVMIIATPPGSVHYAARRCYQCNRFLGWEPRPVIANDEDILKSVMLFGLAMRTRLKQSKKTGWDTVSMAEYRQRMISNFDRGDFLDAANLCFLASRRSKIK